MRRLPVIFAVFAALVTPVAATAASRAAGDGSLVVKHGQAPSDTPVVALRITGSVIGYVGLGGRIVIDGGPTNPDSARYPQVTGVPCITRDGETAQRCKGDKFSFRAVGGTYTVLVYGTDVNVVAVGSGSVRLAGVPGLPSGDGSYSRNGNDFVSLPGVQTDRLTIGSGD